MLLLVAGTKTVWDVGGDAGDCKERKNASGDCRGVNKTARSHLVEEVEQQHRFILALGKLLSSHKILFWLLLKDRLNTRDILERRNVDLDDNSCVFCTTINFLA